MKVTTMKYEKFNIKFFLCPFGTNWFCCHRYMLLGQITKHLYYFCTGLSQQQEQKQCINCHQLTLRQLDALITVTRASQKRFPLTSSIASSQTTFYSASPANDFCGTDYPRCLWHSPPTDNVKIHFRKKFFRIYWYVTFSSQMSLNTEMLEVSQTNKGWIQRE